MQRTTAVRRKLQLSLVCAVCCRGRRAVRLGHVWLYLPLRPKLCLTVSKHPPDFYHARSCCRAAPPASCCGLCKSHRFSDGHTDLTTQISSGIIAFSEVHGWPALKQVQRAFKGGGHRVGWQIVALSPHFDFTLIISVIT